MGVFRNNKRGSRYSSIHNAGAEDTSLSWAARGVLWYLLTKPDKWETRMQDLINHSPAQRDANQRIVKELEQAGYIVRWCSTGAGGHLSWESEVFECLEDAEEWRRDNAEKLAKAVNTKSRKKPKAQAKPTTVDEFTATGFSVNGSTVDGRSIDPELISTATGFSVNGSTVDGEPGCLVITELVNTDLVNTDQDRSIDRSIGVSEISISNPGGSEPEVARDVTVLPPDEKEPSVKPSHTQEDLSIPAKKSSKKKKAAPKFKDGDIQPDIWDEFQAIYNRGKPEHWSGIDSIGVSRRKTLLGLINDYGSVEKALKVVDYALREVCLTDWYMDRILKFENVFTNNKVPGLYESYCLRLSRIEQGLDDPNILSNASKKFVDRVEHLKALRERMEAAQQLREQRGHPVGAAS